MLRYLITYSSNKGEKNNLVLEYNGEKLEYPISNNLLNSKLIRSPVRAGEDKDAPREGMMDLVDQYLPQVPDSSQRIIFETFKQLEDIVHSTKQDELLQRLQSLSFKIFSLPGITPGLPDQNSPIKNYVRAVTEIPATVFRSMDEAPSSYRPESTYLIDEYLDLVELNIYVKIMFPMILVSSARLQSIYNKKYIIKVMEAFCIPEVQRLPAFKKMYGFVEYFAINNYDLNNEKNSSTVTERLLFTANLSSDEVVDYAFSEIITRRAVSARSLHNTESSHAVVRMYSRLSSIRDGKTTIVDKNIADDRGLAADPNKSVGDEFRIKDKTTVDQQVALRFVVQAPYLAQHLGIDEAKLSAMSNFRPRGQLGNVDSLQCDIIRMATGHLITPNSLHLLTKEKMRLMLCATYLFLRKNHPDLKGIAGLLVSTKTDEFHNVVLKALDKGLQKQILAKYPYELIFKAQPLASGRRTSKRMRAPDFVKQTTALYQTHYVAAFNKRFLDSEMVKEFNEVGGLNPVVRLHDEIGTLVNRL